MMQFLLVDVKDITSNIPRSNFAETDLENLADTILESGGIIRPLVLKATDAETYTVVDGHLEYFAAVRAKEKDARKGEMVNAFVISPKVENIVIKQATVLKSLESTEQPVTPTSDTSNLESRLANIELRFEKQFNEFRSEQIQERQRLEGKLKEIESRLPQPTDSLNLLNTLNQDDLALKLQRSRIPGAEKLAKAIYDARLAKKQKEFEDYRDVIKSVKGLGEKTMLTIIDEWSKS